MTSDMALRVAYFALNLVGALAMTLTFLILCLNARRTHDGPFLMSMALCFSRIISTVTSCLLLFSGAMTGKAAPRPVCIAQSGLHASQAPLLAYSILSYALNVLLLMPPPSLFMGTVAIATTTGLLLLPFLTFAAFGVVSALIASQNSGDIHIRLFYCFLDQQDIKNGSALLAGIALLATIATLLRVLYRFRWKDPSPAASGSRWIEDLVLHFYFLGFYAATRLGVLVANTVKPTVVADMVDAADGIIVFMILGTQPWLFAEWLNRGSPGSLRATERSVYPAGGEIPGQHDQFLRRVAECPSVIDIRRSDSRQATSQTPKLRALSAALGLAANDPYTRYHGSGDLVKGEKRATIIEPDLKHHPYSLDTRNFGSQLSLKTLEYGVALGHPSRDASATNSVVRAENATPIEGRPASLIIISTPSEASSHALHLPLDDDGAGSERHRRRLSPLAIPQPGQHTRRASDGSQPHTPLVILEPIRRARDSPRMASFLGISTESLSSGLSPRMSRHLRASLEPPPPASPARPYHFFSSNYDHSTGEGSTYQSASSESSGHILVDDIQSSVQSWPNASRSTPRFLPHDHRAEDDTRHTSFGAFSRSSLVSEPYWIQQHATSSPDEPPHPAFLRETTPSPLSLNDEGSVGGHTFGGGSIGGHTFGGISPERRLHPYTRGPSPLRPPGLGSPLSKWTEEIEETTRKVSDESG